MTIPVLKMFGVMLPAIVIPVWLGTHVYGRIDDRVFRRIVLSLLLVSGVLLLTSTAFSHR